MELGALEGDTVLIGHPDNAVVFDFNPGVDAGAENLARRGEDQRFTEERPAARRRRAIDEAMESRAEGETRADVARRLDAEARENRAEQDRRLAKENRPRQGPMSYEIGSADDPDVSDSGT